MAPTLRGDNADQWGQETARTGALDDAFLNDNYEVVEIDADEADAELLALIGGRPSCQAGWRASS
ncbi:MAG: hypothetical protein ACKVQQ_12685 [Burkholderiales bacterium]